MFKFRLAAAGCLVTALAAASAPAQADTSAAVSASAATTQAAASPQADRQQRAGEPLYCARIEMPARRVRPRICRTRAQWEREFGGLPTR